MKELGPKNVVRREVYHRRGTMSRAVERISMIVSLRDFLMTGRFGDLHSGLSPEEVVILLGSPDAWGGTSSRYRKPSIYLYGSVEIYFTQQSPQTLTGIFWDASEKGLFSMGEAVNCSDWDLLPDMPYPDVENYLHKNEVAFAYHEQVPETFSPALYTIADIRLIFDPETQRLSCISGTPSLS
jgi:hypothetical protein